MSHMCQEPTYSSSSVMCYDCGTGTIPNAAVRAMAWHAIAAARLKRKRTAGFSDPSVRLRCEVVSDHASV